MIRVLVVDGGEVERPGSRDLFAAMDGASFTPKYVEGVPEALRALSEWRPDVVVLDARVGRGFLDRIPAAGDSPPVILLAGAGGEDAHPAAIGGEVADRLDRNAASPADLEASIRRVVAQRRAERDAELRYRMLVESVGAIVWQGDPETLHFSFVNREAESLLGYPVERWTGEPGFWPEHIHPDDRAWVLASCVDAGRRGEPRTVEYRMVAADGRVVWLRDIARPVEIGGTRALAGVMVDVTRAKEAEETLRLRERAVAAVSEGIVITDARAPDNPIVYVNPAFTRMTGYTPDAAVGRNSRFLLGEDTDPEVAAKLRSAVGAAVPVTADLLTYRRDGTPFWARLSISPIHDAHGRLTHYVGVQREINRASAELEAAEAHYRRLVTTAPQAIYALDQEGRFTELNPAGERLIGRTASSVRGRHFAEVILPADLPIAAGAVTQLLSGVAEVVEVEIRVVRPSGEERRINIAATGVEVGGVVTGVHGIARDVTEERSREREVHLLATALEGLREQGVSIVDEEDRVVYANHTHARLLGCEPGKPLSPSADVLLPDEQARRERLEIRAEVARTGGWSGRLRRRRLADGEIAILEMTTGQVVDEGRTLFVNIIQDAGEKIAREQHLRRVERLAGLGTLTAGVAHELNNPLSAVLGFAQLLLLDARSDEEREDLQTIVREAERMAKIVADLRLVAREEEVEAREAVDLNDVVRHVLKTRGYSLKTYNVDVREDLKLLLPPVLAHRGQIEQVVLNLVVNAEQALEAVSGARLLLVRTGATRDCVYLHVGDTGPGIQPDHLEQIFDPFFTTKAPGEGTGLGLSLAHGIISEHGGEIRVDSEIGRGTTVRVNLPRAPVDAEESRADESELAPARSLRVLVVDDEEAVRRMVARLLRRRGHVVDLATDGRQALVLLESSTPGYDVIVSDLRMPGLGGEELLRHLQSQGGGMESRLLFLTGDIASPNAVRIMAESEVPVLAKPAGLADLTQVVERVGHAGGGGSRPP